MQDLRAAGNAKDVLDILRSFARCFELEDLASVLDVVHKLPERNDYGEPLQVMAIAHLAERLHSAGMQEPIVAMLNWVFEHRQGLDVVASSLPASWRDRFLDRLLAEGPTNPVTTALQLWPHLAPDQRESLVRRCTIASWLSNPWSQLPRDFPPDLFDELVDAIVKLPDTGEMGGRGAESGHYSDREHYLMQVASRLSAAQVLRCLSARGRTQDELPFVRWVVRFAPLMPAHVHAIDAALRVVLRMPEEWEMTPATRERAFAALAPRLSANQLATCLEVIERGGICLTQIFGLATLLPHLRDEARRQALDSVRSKIASAPAAEDWKHSVALAALISSVPEDERPLMAQEALAHLRLGFAGHDEALAAVIPFSPPAALNRLLRQMAEPLHERVLGLLPDAVRTLVPHLSERAIRELDEELGEPARRHGLRGQAHCLARLHLIEHLPTSRREAIVAAALEELRDAKSYSYGDDMQERILDRIPADSTGRAADIAYAYADSELRIGALRVLIPKLDEARREKAIDVFLRDVFAVEGLLWRHWRRQPGNRIGNFGRVDCMRRSQADVPNAADRWTAGQCDRGRVSRGQKSRARSLTWATRDRNLSE